MMIFAWRSPRLLFLLFLAICATRGDPLVGQMRGCPEVEFGHPAQALDELVFPVVVAMAPEAFPHARQGDVRVFLRPHCPEARGQLHELRFELVPHVMSLRHQWLQERAYSPANYELALPCAGRAGGIGPPPPVDRDSPEGVEWSQRNRALNRLCRSRVWVAVSLPRQVKGQPDRWYLDMRGWSLSAFDRLRIEFHWEGEGQEPELLSVEHVSGWIS
jgi:hypothetical protein